MQKGIIIIFNRNDIYLEKNINLNVFLKLNLKICLINNGDNTKVEKFLQKLKETSKNTISILNLRKEKSTKAAVKLGVRFLSNLDNFNLLLYAKPKNLCNLPLSNYFLKNIKEEFLTNKEDRVLLRNVYSITEVC